MPECKHNPPFSVLYISIYYRVGIKGTKIPSPLNFVKVKVTALVCDMLFLWFILGDVLSCLFYLLLLNHKNFLVGERRVLSDALFPVSVLSSMATSTSILT